MLTPYRALDALAKWLPENKLSFCLALGTLLLGYVMEDHQSQTLASLQNKSAALISKLDVTTSQVDRIAVVRIDKRPIPDPTTENEPTDRTFLASLIGKVAASHPAVIALDIQLAAEPGELESERHSGNQRLLQAIKSANVPVVLARTLANSGTTEQANIFKDAAVSPARFGFVNLPFDRRRVPLEQRTENAAGEPAISRGFAFEVVTAYYLSRGLERLEDSDPAVSEAIAHHEFVFGGFRKEEEFPSVNAKELLEGDLDVLKKLNQKIVFIGSTWRRKDGRPSDAHLTPLGNMDGVFIHANYAEAMLSGHIKKPTPAWLALLCDLVASIAFLVAYEHQHGWGRFLVCMFLLFPVLISYALSIGFGIYLDFAIPLLLLLLHAFPELLRMFSSPDKREPA